MHFICVHRRHLRLKLNDATYGQSHSSRPISQRETICVHRRHLRLKLNDATCGKPRAIT